MRSKRKCLPLKNWFNSNGCKFFNNFTVANNDFLSTLLKKILYSYSAFFSGNMAGTWHAILRASKIRLRTNKLIINDLLWVEQAFTELKVTFYYFFSRKQYGLIEGKNNQNSAEKKYKIWALLKLRNYVYQLKQSLGWTNFHQVK